MSDETLDQELSTFDFSLCHPIRMRLLSKLLTIHREDNAAKRQHSLKWTAARLGEKDLDCVAAAGAGGNLQNFEEFKDTLIK